MARTSEPSSFIIVLTLPYIDTSLGSSSGSYYGGYASDATAAPKYAVSSPYKGGRPNKATQKKGGIRGLLDSVNSYVAPGITKAV